LFAFRPIYVRAPTIRSPRVAGGTLFPTRVGNRGKGNRGKGNRGKGKRRKGSDSAEPRS